MNAAEDILERVGNRKFATVLANRHGGSPTKPARWPPNTSDCLAQTGAQSEAGFTRCRRCLGCC